MLMTDLEECGCLFALVAMREVGLYAHSTVCVCGGESIIDSLHECLASIFDIQQDQS